MTSTILPSLNNVHARVDVWLDRISEAFDITENERKRCLHGIGAIHALPRWKSAVTFDLWQPSQHVMVVIKPQSELWVDDESHPMMGYIEGLETEFRKPDDPVIVNLATTPSHAEELFRFADASLARSNTQISISMIWRFVEHYRNADGKGSGFPLWYPQSVSMFRETVRRS